MHDILENLCNEYAYAVHQPHARNGGLIGLAAAAIALGSVCQSTNPICVADPGLDVYESMSLPSLSDPYLMIANL